MKKIIINIVILFVTLGGVFFISGLFFAQSSENYTKDAKKGVEDNFVISISFGGGFTATYTTTSINQDGIISTETFSHIHESNNKKAEIIGKIDSKEAKRLFSRLMAINFLNVDYNKGGNVSFSLDLTVNNEMHRVIWSRALDDSAPDEMKTVEGIYSEISEIVKKVTERKVDK